MAYINTDDLFKCETCKRYQDGKCTTWCENYECYSPNMKKIPIADVVEVVRCEECKDRHSSEFCECRDANDFCSDGERNEK